MENRNKKWGIWVLMVFSPMVLGGRPVPANACSGNGNLTLETGDPVKVYKEISDLAQKYKAEASSFNQYANQNKKVQISVQFNLDGTVAAAFMSDVAGLGKVTNQYYNENNSTSLQTIEGQLEDLEGEISALSNVLGKAPMVAGLAFAQRQSLQSQKDQFSKGACISLTISQYGYNRNWRWGQLSGGWIVVFLGLAGAVVFFALGFVFGSVVTSFRRKSG